jgi:hypothetical protein
VSPQSKIVKMVAVNDTVWANAHDQKLVRVAHDANMLCVVACQLCLPLCTRAQYIWKSNGKLVKSLPCDHFSSSLVVRDVGCSEYVCSHDCRSYTGDASSLTCARRLTLVASGWAPKRKYCASTSRSAS